MDAPPSQSRPRQRKRQRVSESGNTANPVAGAVAVTQGWGPAAAHGLPAHSHPQAVRAHNDTVPGQPPTFPSQHLERAHHPQQVVAGPDGLMNGYSAPPQHQQQSQYTDQSAALATSQQADASALVSLASLTGDVSANSQQHQHSHQGHQGLTQQQAHQAHQHHLAQQQHQQLVQQHLPQQQPLTPQHLSQHQQHQHQQQQHQHQQQHQQQQQAQQQQAQQQRPSAANTNKTDRPIFQQQFAAHHAGSDASPTAVANTSASFAHNVWPVTPSAPSAPAPVSAPMPPQSPAPGLQPPPEGIYKTFEDLLASVQKVAKDQGYGVVKLRASNYREGKPTRYDLVCDRGGVKYNSTAKKRTPSTRKVDCPFRAKAVCEVSLANQWRFAVQEGRHNHEPRIPAAVPGQENTPTAQSIRSITNKIDRLSHDMAQGFTRLESLFSARLDSVEKRLDAIEGGRQQSLLGGNGVPSMGTPSMPTANMGGNLGNGPLTNGGMGTGIVDNRLSNMETRVSGLDQRGMDTMPLMDDDTSRLTMMGVPS